MEGTKVKVTVCVNRICEARNGANIVNLKPFSRMIGRECNMRLINDIKVNNEIRHYILVNKREKKKGD